MLDTIRNARGAGAVRRRNGRGAGAARRRERNPARTRERLLHAAFGEIYKSGFRGTDLDTILDKARVTKGALYHHFPSKEALGYEVVDTVLTKINDEKWVEPLRASTNAIDTLITIVKETLLTDEAVNGGCPVNNLAQEMSPLDEEFRKRIANVFRAWQEAVADALRDGQKRKQVRRDVNPSEEALYFTATYEGYMSFAKNSQDAGVLRSGIKRMTRYLESLRAPGPRSAARGRGAKSSGPRATKTSA